MDTCQSRITEKRLGRQFGDGRHLYFLELKCGGPCVAGKDVCRHCNKKNPLASYNYAKSYDHGKVYDVEYTESSHLFGSKWYVDGIVKWGPPRQDLIDEALEFQQEARKYVNKPIVCMVEEMPKKTVMALKETNEIKPRRPLVKKENPLMKEPITSEDEKEEPPVQKEKKVIKRNPPIKKKSPHQVVMESPIQQQRELTVPTHMERTLEEFDVDGYEIQYVRLTVFEHDGTIYFRDSIKNKLYKRFKETSVGSYVGRYDIRTDTVVTDVPDSDDEKDDDV
jgi:hypothetical protein